ncbi:MAG TPA: putative peptidoglycan glycosyltransferase FtsW [Chitinophagaceae bacterium]|nr:cell division protein FtsW [Chitinophagaceae bacterium]HQV05288.1 putative peptidoglycan glycosyltransferase FtsW [Chitinophagaceae bacterium]
MEVAKNIRFSGLRETFKAERLINKTKGDKVIWALVIILSLVSVLAVYSATGSLAYKNYQGNTEYYLFKQFAFVIGGILIIYFAHLVNYRYYSNIAKLLFGVSIVLLAYTLFFGVTMNEGSRWLRLPHTSLTFQTSDFAKLALFMYLARLLSKKQNVIKDFKKGFLPVIIPVLLTCLLIAPANLSTAMLLGASCMLLLFIGRARLKHIAVTVGILSIPVAILVSVALMRSNKQNENGVAAATSGSVLMGRVDTWMNRIESFFNGDNEDNDTYQINQSKIAIANGGTIGLGPGNSITRDYLPQAYNDFIYAIIIEEYGLLGGAFIMFIYLVFLYRCIRIFKRCPFAFGAFLALGLSFTLAIQAVANMAVTVGVLPVTGVTLPLVSMGGTSIIFTCLAIGIILSVARNVEQMESAAAPAVENEGA